jgi:hypothetical protein
MSLKSKADEDPPGRDGMDRELTQLSGVDILMPMLSFAKDTKPNHVSGWGTKYEVRR